MKQKKLYERFNFFSEEKQLNFFFIEGHVKDGGVRRFNK